MSRLRRFSSSRRYSTCSGRYLSRVWCFPAVYEGVSPPLSPSAACGVLPLLEGCSLAPGPRRRCAGSRRYRSDACVCIGCVVGCVCVSRACVGLSLSFSFFFLCAAAVLVGQLLCAMCNACLWESGGSPHAGLGLSLYPSVLVSFTTSQRKHASFSNAHSCFRCLHASGRLPRSAHVSHQSPV